MPTTPAEAGVQWGSSSEDQQGSASADPGHRLGEIGEGTREVAMICDGRQRGRATSGDGIAIASCRPPLGDS